MRSQYLNVIERQTDGQTTCHGNTALCVSIARKKTEKRRTATKSTGCQAHARRAQILLKLWWWWRKYYCVNYFHITVFVEIFYSSLLITDCSDLTLQGSRGFCWLCSFSSSLSSAFSTRVDTRSVRSGLSTSAIRSTSYWCCFMEQDAWSRRRLLTTSFSVRSFCLLSINSSQSVVERLRSPSSTHRFSPPVTSLVHSSRNVWSKAKNVKKVTFLDLKNVKT